MLFAGETFSISGGVVGMAFLLGLPASLGFLGVAICCWYGSNLWMYSGLRIPLITTVLGWSCRFCFAMRHC